MDIFKKIEEIKQKPEEERMKYVWFFVLISMFFIVIVWIFSMKSNMVNSKPEKNLSDSIADEFQKYEEPMQESIDDLKNVVETGKKLKESR